MDIDMYVLCTFTMVAKLVREGIVTNIVNKIEVEVASKKL